MKIPHEIVIQPIEKLIPYARNARTHSDAQVAQIAASMREWGWTNPCLITPDGMIVAGHGRVLAAQRLGQTEIPCIVADGWTDAQVRAYVIADNRLAENASWDRGMLSVELDDLRTDDFDLELLGFDHEELSALLDGEEGVGSDEEAGQAGTVRLSDRFLIPPFTVLNARDGWWQERKRAWLALGIRSELGRGECVPGGGARGALRAILRRATPQEDSGP